MRINGPSFAPPFRRLIVVLRHRILRPQSSLSGKQFELNICRQLASNQFECCRSEDGRPSQFLLAPRLAGAVAAAAVAMQAEVQSVSQRSSRKALALTLSIQLVGTVALQRWLCNVQTCWTSVIETALDSF